MTTEAVELSKEAIGLFSDDTNNPINIGYFYKDKLNEYIEDIDSPNINTKARGYVLSSVLYDAIPKPIDGKMLNEFADDMMSLPSNAIEFLEKILKDPKKISSQVKMVFKGAIETYRKILCYKD